MTDPNRHRFRLKLTPSAETARSELEGTDPRRFKKINKALRFLSENPGHNGLQAHKWGTLKGLAPDQGDVWTAYVENNTPSAWRIFFYYPKDEPGTIYVLALEPHS